MEPTFSVHVGICAEYVYDANMKYWEDVLFTSEDKRSVAVC
jgi:hypothetical protein